MCDLESLAFSSVFANIPPLHAGWELHTSRQPNAIYLQLMQKQCIVAAEFIGPPRLSGRKSSGGPRLWVLQIQQAGESEEVFWFTGGFIRPEIRDRDLWTRKALLRPPGHNILTFLL